MDKVKIRKRESYSRWLRLLNLLRGNLVITVKLKQIHGVIDAMSGYGSKTKAIYANESLSQLIEDVGEAKNELRNNIQ